ncbi:MAG: divalent metal cation transporter [Spirochaetes bacterium]|nr:divalent metal cation transporter [Spirochaetota bacterium]
MGDKNISAEKSKARILLGAAFLMGISAIGPGFLNQTANFTAAHGASHGFIILISVILGLGVQINVWRIICVSGMRGQDIANKVLPGLGYFLAFLVGLGGLAFNIGNVGGAAMGLNAMANVPVELGYWICGLLGIAIFVFKDAKSVTDLVMKILGFLMIGIVLFVMFSTRPPIGEAALRTFAPLPPEGLGMVVFFFPIMTYLGGTVGGYITFSGAHRLLDANITGTENLRQITKSSVQGISIATVMRILLFLAIFGVIAMGFTLDPEPGRIANPAAVAFYRSPLGIVGYRFFGLLLLIAGLTSVIGAAYTSVTFLKTLFKPVMKYERFVTIGFIAVSTFVMSVVGNPAQLLILVGFLNGLILPVSMTVMLLACRRKDIVGEDYKHPMWLIVAGIAIVGVTAFLSVNAFPSMLASMAAFFGG